MMKKLTYLILAVMLLSPALAQPQTRQDLANINPSHLFLKTQAQIVDLLGQPTYITPMGLPQGTGLMLIFEQPSQDRTMWVLLFHFSAWYPNLPSWQAIFSDKERLVVSVSYYPKLEKQLGDALIK